MISRTTPSKSLARTLDRALPAQPGTLEDEGQRDKEILRIMGAGFVVLGAISLFSETSYLLEGWAFVSLDCMNLPGYE